MKPTNPYISLAMMLAGILCIALSGCASGPDAPSKASEMSVSFRVETRNGAQESDGEGQTSGSDEYKDVTKYEDATEWENYIDITKGDYRIGFFDTDNVCITPFTPTDIKAVENSNYTEYTLTGEVPGILTLYSDFKIVVLANWNKYPEMKTGITTIDDLSCPGGTEMLGQFEHFEGTEDGKNFQIAEEGSRYVPMYGVKEYKGVKFGINNKNEPTVLYEGNFGPVNMLRAIAKVELIFDTKDPFTLDTTQPITITNYNDYGFCAPEGAYLETDYYHGSWNADYRQGFLHLVGGMNDSGDEKPLSMTKMTITTTTTGGSGETAGGEGETTGTSSTKTVWVAYLPEYRNVGSTDTGKTDCNNSENSAASGDDIKKARIAVPLIREGQTYTSYIEFATYKDGEPGQPINIERNNLYRFTVTHVDQGVKWKVEALPWNCLKHPTLVM